VPPVGGGQPLGYHRWAVANAGPRAGKTGVWDFHSRSLDAVSLVPSKWVSSSCEWTCRQGLAVGSVRSPGTAEGLLTVTSCRKPSLAEKLRAKKFLSLA